ncbi:MAG: hypothetical protein RR754_05655 [Oscillospiraceae bacterium]
MQKGIVTSITLKPQYSCTVTIKNFAALQSLQWNLPFETIDNGASALISLIGGKEYHLEHI